MSFNSLNLKSKLLVGLIPVIVVFMISCLFIINSITKSALNSNINSSVELLSHIAAGAVKTGLEFGDNESVANTLEVYVKENDISMASVLDTKNAEVFNYRKEGYPKVDPVDEAALQKIDNEKFITAEVVSGDEVIGKVIMGMSLVKRDEALSSVFISLSLVALAGVVLLGFVTIFLANRLSNPLKELTNVAEQLGYGNLNQDVSIVGQDEMGKLADSFRTMISSLENKAKVAQEIAEGNLDLEIQITSGDDVLGKAMEKMKTNLGTLIEDILVMNAEQKSGDSEAFVNSGNFSGVYARLAEGVNESLHIHIENIQKALNTLTAYADGDFSAEMERLPGKQAVINERVDGIKNNLQNLIEEVLGLTARAKSGDLSARGHSEHFKGGYKEIIEGINDTLEAIAEPVSASQEVLLKMADGNLKTSVEGEYAGDYAIMVHSLNKALDSLNGLLGHVAMTVDKVASGAQQVSDSSQAVSQGATEQASSLEEITASITEVSGQSRQNADNAAEANALAVKARESADKGNIQMKQMLEAMVEINQGSKQISKIIKVIDEIAFQTNLLALNAAVEAARAGVHGKGFAVVAEEVRNLAQRSAKAASETTELIEGSIAKVEKGSQIANISAEALSEIIQSITQVSDIMGEIANASNEQVQGIEQISQGLQQIDQVTQTNTANAEESASAADELSDTSRRLRSMLSKFQLRNVKRSQQPDFEEEDHSSLNAFEVTDYQMEKTDGYDEAGEESVNPADMISLDADEFGKF